MGRQVSLGPDDGRDDADGAVRRVHGGGAADYGAGAGDQGAGGGEGGAGAGDGDRGERERVVVERDDGFERGSVFIGWCLQVDEGKRKRV